MDSMQTEKGNTLADGGSVQATVREPIMQLALTEEERRNAVNPRRITVLTRCEQTIVAALRANGLSLKSSGCPNLPISRAVLFPLEEKIFQE